MEIKVFNDNLSARVPIVQRHAELREGSPDGFTHRGPLRGSHVNLARHVDIVNIHRAKGCAHGERAQTSRMMPY